MPARHRAGRATRLSTILARAVAYLLLAWTTLIVLAAGLFPGAALVVLVIALYTTVPLVAFVRWRGWPFYPGRAFRLLVVRPFWYTQLLLPLVAGAGLLGLLAGALFGDPLLVGRVAAALVFVVVAVVLGAGYFGSQQLVVRDVDVVVPRLPAEFDQLRIAQLSDLHVGPHTSRSFLHRVVRTTQALTPDIIAITGDLIDDRAEDVAVFARELRALDAPLGVFMIPGNHDVYAGWDEVEGALRDAKLGTVLVNELALIQRGEATIAIVGTGDPAGGARGNSRAAPDVELAMAKVPDNATVIAFAHNPALWPSLAARGVALTLSGHTHWGQFALPRLGWSLASPFLEHAMGAHIEEEALLYINPGTGYWGIPFRLGASPEITLVTLHHGEPASARVYRARKARRVA
ncbi:MAG TPA: metallophosphoesterase [Gemmatimonadaceae bacterium]